MWSSWLPSSVFLTRDPPPDPSKVVLVMAAGWGRSGMEEVLARALQGGGGGCGGTKELEDFSDF